MINILHIINSFDKGGAEMMLLKFLKETDKKKFINIVICLKSTGFMTDIFEKYDIKSYHIKMNTFFDLFSSLKLIFQIIKIHNPVVIMSWLHISDLISFFIKIKFPKIKIIWNLRCSAPKISILGVKSWVLVKILGFVSKIPDCIIANSQYGLDSHIKIGYKPNIKRVLHNGFDTNKFKYNLNKNLLFRKKYNIRINDFVIGFIGKKAKIKGLDLFVNSINIINKKYKNLKFVFVGKELDNSNISLYNELKKKDCLKNSIMLGEKNNLEGIITSFDLLVITSRSEGFPNVLGEAMSIKVPCVSTDVGDCKYIIGNEGIIVKSFDTIEISNAIEKFYKMPLKNKLKMGVKARKRIKSEFNIEKIVSVYENLIMSVTNGSIQK